MKRFIIERDISGVQNLDALQCGQAAKTSNSALSKLGGKVHWEHSYVVNDKTFCVYLAEDESAIQEHAKLSGFPANKVSEVKGILTPEMGNA